MPLESVSCASQYVPAGSVTCDAGVSATHAAAALSAIAAEAL